MAHLIHVVVALACLCLVEINCQSGKKEWTGMELDNPQTNAVKCGFPNNYPAYICDPNGILRLKDLQQINWILGDAAYNSTKCPCSTYHCETGKKPLGYKIGVALIQKMKTQRSSDGKLMTPEDMAQKFTHDLKNSKWMFGQCEEDIYILYSVDDKMLSIYTGRTAGTRLTAYYRDLLAYKIGGRLNDGRIVEALNTLLYDIKTVLNCDAASTSDCNLYERQGASSSALGMSSTSMLTTTTTLASLLFAVLFRLY